MKELLIKIRALFEGSGISDAKNAVDGLNNTSNRAGGGLTRLQTCIDGAAAKAGIFGGAVSALGGQLLNMAAGAVMGAVAGINNLVSGMVQGVIGAARFTDTIAEMGVKTGQTIQTVLTLMTAFKNAGMSGESVAPVIVRLQNALAGVNEDGQPTAEIFAKIGLKVSELKAMSADQQLEAIGGALNGIADPSERAAAGMAIFGRSWSQVAAVVLDTQALAVAREQLGELATVIAANQQAFGAFADSWERFGELKVQQFFTGVAAAFAGDMEKAAAVLNGIDLTRTGMTIGNMLKDIQAMTEIISMPFTDAWKNVNTVLDLIVGKSGKFKDVTASAISAAANSLNPVKGVLDQLDAWVTSASTRADQQLANMKAQAEAAKTATSTAGAQAVDSAAHQGAAAVQTAGAEAAEGIKLTADQIKLATQQIAAAMTQANAEGVTPALTALTTAVQESFARITGELTSALATMQSAQAEQVPAFTEAVAQLTATMAASTEATTAATATIAQSVTASAEKTVAATQQSAQAINQAFGQISQAIVQSNQAMANGLSSLASSVSSSLANLQQQINAVAARIR
jgi:hypothetical protein